jgi:RNA polymerase sigma-70 factor (ECF subfamily)
MTPEIEFERVVDLYYPSLYRFALSLTRRESDACDLTQETFYIWAKKGHQVRDDSKVKSWLFTTMHREYLQKHRRLTRFPEVELSDAEGELPETPAPSPARLERQSLLNALGRLDENFRGAVALFYLEDCSYPQIAEILGIPLGTVKSRISRGISEMQAMLSESRMSTAQNPSQREVACG